MAMKASDWVVGMCEDCDEMKMMHKDMAGMAKAKVCDACSKPLVWKK